MAIGRASWRSPRSVLHDRIIHDMVVRMSNIDRFFREKGNPPVIGVSDTARLLNVDETIVRRWCRENDVFRLGPNFGLTPKVVGELVAALDE